MADTPDLQHAFDRLMQAQAAALRADDRPPASRKAWDERRKHLRAAMLAAMGPFPDKDCPLEPQHKGVLRREGYRIEKLVFQSRPDVWVTATAYVPDPLRGKAPAVLAVHGHWKEGRRSPVVQARCLGLVKLGFFVLAVDAFGAGERHPTEPAGAYHGALLGSTLWPVGQTLLGMQVYDNHRAVDYLLSRPEVDPKRLGITGASGGGNQTMYAGALDERLAAVVPVCSVGSYQAYLHAACCVCEVLPGALRFTEEGDVLGLVAPRALMVINASRDAYQFSVEQAKKSLVRTRRIFELHGAADKLRHVVIDSGHDYNQAMREAMYGWMTRWLKGEGDGKPIAEPGHRIESQADLACYPDGKRPDRFLFPASYAAREARRLLASTLQRRRDHKEAWEAEACVLRQRLRDEVLGPFPTTRPGPTRTEDATTRDGVRTTPLLLHPEPDLPLPATLKQRVGIKGKMPACVLLHLDGKDQALQHPLAAALLEGGWAVLATDLRGTGATRPANDAIAGAPDHNSTEHALWIGRPLLGQWLFDVQALLDWIAGRPGLDAHRLAMAGIGQAGVIALAATGLFDTRVAAALALDGPVSLITERAYAEGTHMGLLAPGLLRIANIPQLAALAAPRPLVLAGGVSPQKVRRSAEQLRQDHAFTRQVYGLYRAADQLRLAAEMEPAEMVGRLS